MEWVKYIDLEPFRRLKQEGRELLGKEIFITEKRDGSNVSIWLDEKLEPHISSHNLAQADDTLTRQTQSTSEYLKILEYLKEEVERGRFHIAYGELIFAGKGPTRIEPTHKKATWVLFDMRDMTNNFLNYTALYQIAYHFKLPIVKCLGIELCKTIEELVTMRDKWLKYCRRHRREGIVGKNYTEQIFFKEKVDIPKFDRKNDTNQGVQLPDMPTEKCIRALQHAWDEINMKYAQNRESIMLGVITPEEAWKDKSIAMPIVAKHFSMEAKEHNYKMGNPYWFWVNTPIEEIKVRKE